MAISTPLTELLANGQWGDVRAVVCANGKNWVVDFLNEELDKMVLSRFPHTTARQQAFVWFQMLANDGDLPLKRFRGEAEGFMAVAMEIKKKQIRFPCFRDGDAWIVTHGFFKPGAKKKLGKWPAQVARAVRLRDEYRAKKIHGPQKANNLGQGKK